MIELTRCNYEIVETANGNYVFDGLHFTIHKERDEYIKFLKNIKKNHSFPPKGEFPNEFYVNTIRKIRRGLWFAQEDIQILDIEKANPILIVSFAPVHECNLRCRYCFADSGKKYKGSIRTMESATLENTFEILKKRFSNCSEIRLEFVSGGEPLLNSNIIIEAVLLAKKIFAKVYIYLVTNGTIYDEKLLNFLENYNVAIGFSIDGPQEIHDKTRVYPNGEGSYLDVIANVKKTFNHSIRKRYAKTIWTVCVITTKTNSLVEILENALENGFDAIEMRIARGPVTNPLFLSQDTIEYFKTLYCKLQSYIIDCLKKGEIKSIIMLLNESDTWGKIIKRLLVKKLLFYRCAAGKTKFSIACNGDIYPCDSFVGSEEFKLGDATDLKNVNVFCEKTIDKISPCQQCGFRYLCTGDCYYSSYINCNDICHVDKIHCEMNRYLIGLAIHVVHILENDYPELYDKLVRMAKYRDMINPL